MTELREYGEMLDLSSLQEIPSSGKASECPDGWECISEVRATLAQILRLSVRCYLFPLPQTMVHSPGRTQRTYWLRREDARVVDTLFECLKMVT